MYAFLSAISTACSGEERARINTSVCYCTAVAWWVGWLVGGWLGRWMSISYGTWVVFVAKVEADVVLVRLLCSARGVGVVEIW